MRWIMLRFSIILSFWVLFFGLQNVADAQIYVRIHQNGQKEFTNRPSGPGWIFYMTESGYIPDIRFAREGKPKGLDEIVEEIADGFSIDANLVKAIIVVESKCDTMAVSKRGAQGLMQLMPATAKELKVANVFDARDNVVGGVKYIKGLIASYGNLRLALAAYNAGPGTVTKYAGIPPYRETRDYVEKVLRYCDRFKNDPTLRIAGN
jgi:soluble lytic murein transglycosylase-like protein